MFRRDGAAVSARVSLRLVRLALCRGHQLDLEEFWPELAGDKEAVVAGVVGVV